MPVPLPDRRAPAELLAELLAALRASTWRARLREGFLLVAALALGAVQLALDEPLLPAPDAVVVAGTLITAVAVLGRGRWPTAALAAAALLLAVPLVTWPLVPVVVFAAARHLPPARLWRATGAAAGALLLVDLVVRSGGEPLPVVVVGWAAGVALLLVAPAVCGALVGRRRPAGRLLRERERYLDRTRTHIADRARRAELARITGEMHDMLGHRLALLSVHAGALEAGTARLAPAVSAQAELVRRTAGTALAELRQILELQGGPAEPGPPDAGTRADAEALVRGSREAGLGVELQWGGPDLVDADGRVRQAVHRVVREGLANVHRHAPSARSTAVGVVVADGRCRVRVENDAPAVPPGGGGTAMGLIGLQQRASLLGGTCRGRPRDDGGFVLVLDVPLQPPARTPEPALRAGNGSPDDDPPPPPEVMTRSRFLAVVAVGVLIVALVLLGLAALAPGGPA